MPTLLNEIEWGEPILPVVKNPEWERQVKHELGGEFAGDATDKPSFILRHAREFLFGSGEDPCFVDLKQLKERAYPMTATLSPASRGLKTTPHISRWPRI